MLKKLVITALLLILIGVGGSIAFYNSSNNTTTINETQSIDYSTIDALQLDTISTDVEIIASKEQQEATIELIGKVKEANAPKLAVEVKGSRLVIDIQETRENKWFNLSPNFAPETLLLKLHVPEKLVHTIEFKGISADVYLENIHSNSLKLATTSGDIDGENLQFQTADIQTVSGDLELEKLLGEASITTESGDIYLTMADLIHPIEITSTSGDVELITSNEPTDVNFQVKSVSGDINLLGKYNESAVVGKGTTLVDIQTTSGDISVEN